MSLGITRRCAVASLFGGGALASATTLPENTLGSLSKKRPSSAQEEEFAVYFNATFMSVRTLEGVNIYYDKERFYWPVGFIGPHRPHVLAQGRMKWQSARFTWRELDRPDQTFSLAADGSITGGRMIADHSMALPETVRSQLNRRGVKSASGGYLTSRLKLLLHDDGILIAWDDQASRGDLAADGTSYHNVGGDFRESVKVYDRRFVQGEPKPKVVSTLKGWYLHPKTKERIEADF
jgi:hypothetical protein